MLGHVLQRFLRGAVYGGLDVLGHPAAGGLDLHVELRERVAQAFQAGGQPEVVEYRRAQPGDRGPGLVQRGDGQLLRQRDLLGRRLGITGDGVGRGRQVEEQAHDALADPVVDLPGEPAALVFLPLDRPLRELLERLLPFGQPPVQPGVLDRARDQARHRAQQLGVGGGELPAQPGVHVQHPHQVTQRGHDGDRRHGGELLPAQRRDVQVAGVGGLVVHDHGRLAVGGDPAGHALAQPQLDLPHQGVEGRGGALQPQGPAPLVEQVHEAHVRPGGLGHQPRHALQHPPEVQAARDGVDNPRQQLRLALGVHPVQTRAGQWNTPSRRATATAAARSETPSLR